VAVLLLAFFVWRYPAKGFGFPVGPDAPVYLWWTRLAGHEGLSAVGVRSGLPALALMMAGALHVSQAEVLAGLGAALGAATGLAAAALVATAAAAVGEWADPAGATRLRWVLAAVLAGTFAIHLADGYYANLAFVVVFLAACAALICGTRPATVGAGALLAAGAIAHPLFFAVGTVILVLAAASSLLGKHDGRREGVRIAAALVGGGAAGGALLGSVLIGADPYTVDTSKDAFLRRAGLDSSLRHDYLDRLSRHWARYWLPVSVPLAGWAALRERGPLGRLLRAWGVVTVVGIAGALVTGLAPADRFITFAYVLPTGAAIALPWLWQRLAARGRILATSICALLVAAMIGGAFVTSLRSRPFLEPAELRAVAAAGGVAESAPAGTPLVFLVDNRRPTISFLATRAGNVIRAGLPPGLIRDVYVYVGSPRQFLAGRPTLIGEDEHDALSRLYLRDLRAAGGRPMAFVLRPFNPAGFREAGIDRTREIIGPGAAVLQPFPRGVFPGYDAPRPAPGWRLVLVGLASLGLLVAVGLGWSVASVGGGLAGGALAPAFGAGALVLAGVLADRLGLRLGGPGSGAVAAAVGVAGYVLALVRPRRDRGQPAGERIAGAQAPDEVDE